MPVADQLCELRFALAERLAEVAGARIAHDL
jgi:hypothetical protein